MDELQNTINLVQTSGLDNIYMEGRIIDLAADFVLGGVHLLSEEEF